MADSSLTAIQTKVRRLTRSPSEAQLPTATLNEYINTFVLYDFPEHLRLFNLRTTLTFWCEPFIDTYTTNTTDPTDPLYNFINKYISVHDPVYIAGYKTFYSQSRDQFFNIYPFVNSIQQVASGDGFSTTFSGTLPNIPVARNNVTFAAVTGVGTGLECHDDGNGNLVGDVTVPGTINYLTGAFSFDFTAAPGSGLPVNSETYPYVPARPLAMLFYDGIFTLRPIPDQPYPVNFEVYIRPTELLTAGQTPELQEWWQYISYGAAKKVFEDRMDLDSVALIMPEYKKQEALILRRTIVQYTNERTATIFTEQTGLQTGSWGWGGGPF